MASIARAEIVPTMAMALALSMSPSLHAIASRYGREIKIGIGRIKDESFYCIGKILGKRGANK